MLFVLLLSISCFFLSTAEIDYGNNVFGKPMEVCCTNPMTGFYRNGYCSSGPEDTGTHIVCAIMTDEFLRFTKDQGNDLSTPNADYEFPGLKAGDCWCLCALRWREALRSEKAPKVKLEATHEHVLDFVTMKDLMNNKA